MLAERSILFRACVYGSAFVLLPAAAYMNHVRQSGGCSLSRVRDSECDSRIHSETSTILGQKRRDRAHPGVVPKLALVWVRRVGGRVGERLRKRVRVRGAGVICGPSTWRSRRVCDGHRHICHSFLPSNSCYSRAPLSTTTRTPAAGSTSA
jgi:hypothetical protein